MVTPRGDEDIEKGEFNTAVQKPEYNAEDRQDGGTRERIVWQQEQPEHMHTLLTQQFALRNVLYNNLPQSTFPP